MFNTELTPKFCPFLIKQIIVHNEATDYRMLRVGLNRCCDNDVIISDFLPCMQEECMAWDTIKQQCKRL